MAKRGGHTKPQYSISTSVKVGEGKYRKGESFGLWINLDGVPHARGSVKGEYLEKLAKFLTIAANKDLSVSFALFRNNKKSSDDDEGGEWSDKESKEEEDDEKEEKRSKKSSPKGSEKSSGKSGKKGKSDWDFDDD